MWVTPLIERKRDGQALRNEDWRAVIAGYVDGRVPDYQMAALAMAVLFRGLTDDECRQYLQLPSCPPSGTAPRNRAHSTRRTRCRLQRQSAGMSVGPLCGQVRVRVVVHTARRPALDIRSDSLRRVHQATTAAHAWSPPSTMPFSREAPSTGDDHACRHILVTAECSDVRAPL